VTVAAGLVAGLVAIPPGAPASAAPARPTPGTPNPAGGPASRYDCALNLTTDAFTGADGTASAMGWEGNGRGVVTCLGGTFEVQERNFTNYGFGIYDGSRTSWSDVDGYLPAQVTTFRRSRAQVAITEFADRIVLAGDAYVAVYCRVSVTNPTAKVVDADPLPSPGLVPLDAAPDAVAPHATSVHDYVVAVDRFGNSYPWPTSEALQQAGDYAQHFAHMRAFWQRQLAAIARVQVPDVALDDAYRAGFIETQIARSGNDLDTGVNGYQSEYTHDVIGILTNLFTQGYFTDAHALLLEARNVVGSGLLNPCECVDGAWTYSVAWAVYLMKTGDVGFVKANFAAEGPSGAKQPSIEDTAHQIATDRTGPSSTMEATDDIDTVGYWTSDDDEALLGLAAYAYLAGRVGDATEEAWATQQYEGLLAATNSVLAATIRQYHLDYLPCSLLQPNTANRCTDPEDANWASPIGAWAWEASLFGAAVDGPGASLIDATYAYGFARLRGRLPPETFGGYPGDYYSSGYNAAYGTAGLAGGPAYRDEGILGYEFMVTHSQSGPYSFWESSSAPSTTTPWIGRHPASGQGSSPHAWGLAGADKVLLDSIVAQAANGSLVVGRGIPDAWLGQAPVSVENFAATGGRRLGVRIVAHGRSLSFSFSGRLPPGPVLLELPAFVHGVATTSTGTTNEHTGTVTLPPGSRRAVVTLRRLPSTTT
jgi:hypothetical protein